MPKRTREDEAKASPPLSALAARRLRSQETTPPVPKTPESKKKSTGARPIKENTDLSIIDATAATTTTTTTTTTTNTKSEAADDLTVKRCEIEEKLRDQLKTQAQARPAVEYGNPGLEESALARVRRRSGEVSSMAVGSNDNEMMDVSELVELRSEDEAMASQEGEISAQVNLSYSGEKSILKLTQVSTFVPTEQNHSQTADKKQMIFRMVYGETLVILGEYDLQVTEGTITVSGATLTQSSGIQTVYAPSSQSLPVIRCSGRKGNKEEKNGGEFDAEVLVRSPKSNSGLREVGKLCSMFGGIWSLPGSARQSEGMGAFSPLYSTTYNFPTLSIPKSWESVFNAFSQKISCAPSSFSSTIPPVIVITGSKGTGKSTFARTLVNNLLTSPSTNCSAIAYLDVDPGQPEFSPPGFLSLHKITSPILGPPFTHPSLTNAIRSHYTGYNSPREEPGHYVASIINLITLYRDLLASATTAEDVRIPLIINTAGWTKGLGLELLADIVTQSQASDIVFISGALERSNPVAEIVPESAMLHEIESISSSAAPARFSAADLRTLQIMSYLHHNPEKAKWDFATPLTNIPPWVVPYIGPTPGVDAIAVIGEQVDAAELITAVEGTLVGVVLVEEEDLGTIVYTADGIPYLHNAPPPPAPESSFSAGMALIRAVDIKQGILQILTNISEEQIERWDREGWKVVLVRGRVELPVWEMIGTGVEAPWVAIGSAVGREGKGGEVWRVRRNVMRRGQQMRGE